MYDKSRLIELLIRDALQVGYFTLSSGKTSPYYLDVRKVTLSNEGARLIVEGMLEIFQDLLCGVYFVGGVAIGAAPIVSSLVYALQVYGFLIRTVPKDHGTKSMIEGVLQPGSTVAIVDDVATTGGSLLKAIDTVEAIGCKVAVVIAVVDRLEGARQVVEDRGLSFRSLVTVRDLMGDIL
jgi:orotate phosphoribosyltransferase